MQHQAPFSVTESAGVDREAWPITQGIPFADGVLEAGTPVCVVDEDGLPLPTQARVLATWGPDRRFVKWLLIDFQADLRAGRTHRFSLTHGSAGPMPPEPLTASAEGNGVRIDTGRIALTVDADDPGLLRAGGLPTEGVTLYMTDGGGRTYRGQAEAVTLEEAGPLRACVLVRGEHRGAEGERFCPFVLRLHFFAGRGDVRVYHSFTFDQDPEAVALAGVGLHIAGPGAQGGTCFGGEIEPHPLDACNAAHFVQHDASRYTLTQGEQKIAAGSRTRSWCQARAPRGALTAILRDGWQEHPFGLELTEAGLDIQLLPDLGEPLSFANPFAKEAIRFDDFETLDEAKFAARINERPDAPLNLKSLGIGHRELGMPDEAAMDTLCTLLEKHARQRTFCFADTGPGSAHGFAKTHELWLSISDKPRPAEACENLARAVQRPAVAVVEPAYLCGTGVLRLTHPKDPARFPEAEAAIDKLFDKLVLEPQTLCGIDGMIDYGEMVFGHSKSNPVVYRHFKNHPERWAWLSEGGRRRGILDVLGLFNNEAQDVINQLWVWALRSGDERIYRFAEAKSEHTADVDFIHLHPANPSRRGLMHYHNITNFSGPPSPSHSLTSGLMLHHFATGNPRSLEVALGVADHHVRTQTRAGVIGHGGLLRETTGPLMCVLEAYQATWDGRYGALAERTLSWLRPAISETGNLPTSVYPGGEDGGELWAEGADNRTDYPGGMVYHVMHDAHRLFGWPWLRDWIITLADHWLLDVRCDDYIPAAQLDPPPGKPAKPLRVFRVAEGWYWRSFIDYSNNYFDPVVAMAYHLTGDEKYLGYLHHRLSIFPRGADEAAASLTPGTFNAINHWGDAVASVMSALAGIDERTLGRAYESWKQQRRAAGHPVFEGDRTRFEPDGRVIGVAENVRMHAFGARDTRRYRIAP